MLDNVCPVKQSWRSLLLCDIDVGQVESFWLSHTLPVPTASATSSSSVAGTALGSAVHSRTSSLHNLAALSNGGYLRHGGSPCWGCCY